jgi:hypothetical protein
MGDFWLLWLAMCTICGGNVCTINLLSGEFSDRAAGDEIVYGARFRQEFTLEDAIEFHAFASLTALPCV